MKQIQEYQIPKGATLDVCLSPQGAYDTGLEAIKPKYTAGTSAQFAGARVAEARASGRTDGPLNSSWAWVAEGLVYLPKRFDADVLFVPKGLNPVLKYAVQATQMHRNGMEFTITDEHVEQIAGAKGVLRLAREKMPSSIDVDAIGRESVTEFLGWDSKYGKLLKDRKIKAVPLYLVSAGVAGKQEQAFCRGLWVVSLILGSSSAIYGNLNLINGGCVFGVRAEGASEQPEAASQGVRSTPQRAVSSGSAGIVVPTLEQVLAVTSRFTADVNKDALQKELAGLYCK